MKKEILDIAIEKTNALIHAEHCCKELQDAAGAVYCDCAACSLVEQILKMKAALLALASGCKYLAIL